MNQHFQNEYIPEPNSGCWIWLGKLGGRGYGCYGRNNRAAHRLSWEIENGPIPDGLVVDHKCRNILCVNPSHLEPVTNVENVLRGKGPTALNAAKTHCHKGHEFTPKNTKLQIRNGRVSRSCKKCQVAHVSRNKRKKKAALTQELS